MGQKQLIALMRAMVGKPRVLTRHVEEVLQEPFERVLIDVPDDYGKSQCDECSEGAFPVDLVEGLCHHCGKEEGEGPA